MGKQRCLVTKKLYHSGKITNPGSWIWLGGSTASALSKNGAVVTLAELEKMDYQSIGKLGDALFFPGTLEKAHARGISRDRAFTLAVENAEEFGRRRVGIPSLVEGITIVDLLGWRDGHQG